MKKFKESGLSADWIDGNENIDKNEEEKNEDKTYRFSQTNMKDWKKLYPHHSVDLRSDESMNAKTYYLKKDENDTASLLYFKKKGDGSIISKQIESIKKPKEILTAKETASKWRDYIAETYKYLGKNSKSLKEHEGLVSPLVKEYSELNAFGLVALKMANKELSMQEKSLFLLEDK